MTADDPRIGVGRSFREPGWLERLAARFRSAAARTPAWRPIKRAYERLLAWMPGAAFVSTLPGGERVRLDPAHRQLAWNVEEYEAFKAAVRPGSIVLDIGANLGAYTVLFAHWVRPAGRVYAFEPAPESRSGLERQLALNRATAEVTVRAEAIASASGVRQFRASGLRGDNRLGPPSLRFGEAGSHSDDAIDVPAISIDDFCAREGIEPDVIKIDVEGAELEALRGARRTIARAGGRLSLFMELHPSIWAQTGVTRADVEAELREQGLTLERIDGSGDPWAIEGICLRVRRDR
jgi:FkbM family methyltransferase